MTTDFESDVSQLLKDFVSHRGFSHNETIASGKQEVVIYDSKACKIAFYKSPNDGEVNCKIGKANASNDDIGGDGWFFLNSLISGDEELSIEELLAAVPSSPKGFDEQLENLTEKLIEEYEMVIGALVKK